MYAYEWTNEWWTNIRCNYNPKMHIVCDLGSQPMEATLYGNDDTFFLPSAAQL